MSIKPLNDSCVTASNQALLQHNHPADFQPLPSIKLQNGYSWRSLFKEHTALKIGAIVATTIFMGVGCMILSKGSRSGIIDTDKWEGEDVSESGTLELNVNYNDMDKFSPDSLCRVNSLYRNPYGHVFPSGSATMEQKNVKDYIETIRNNYLGKAYQYNVTINCELENMKKDS